MDAMRRLALAVLITGLVACGGSPGAGPVEADASSGRVSTEMRDAQRFVPNRFVKVKPGAQVTVELKNTGALPHSFVSPELRVADPVKVDAGKTGSVTFTAPAAAGTYKFVCNEPGHAEAGMTGEVVVQ
jgi:uncharacterized cupredoxin-like copper-binding protein